MLGLGMCPPEMPSELNLQGLLLKICLGFALPPLVQQLVFVLLNGPFLKEKGVFGKKKFQLKLLLSSAPVRCHPLLSLHPKAQWD